MGPGRRTVAAPFSASNAYRYLRVGPKNGVLGDTMGVRASERARRRSLSAPRRKRLVESCGLAHGAVPIRTPKC